jgi:AcrR family transcriptional regulator
VPRRGLNTEQVVDAAARLADDGLETVTLARLAQELDVRAPSLYNHVDGRPGLLRLISLRGLNQLTGAISAAAVGRSGVAALSSAALAYRDFARANPGLYEATLAAPPGGDPELQAAAERLLGLIAAILTEWRLEGDELIDAIRVIRSGLHGFVTLERRGGFAMPRDLDASYDRLIATLVAGLDRD